MTKQRFFLMTITVIIILAAGTFAVQPGIVRAITELTPTPDGDEPTTTAPQPTATIAPTTAPTTAPEEPTTTAEPSDATETAPSGDENIEALFADATAAFQSGDFDGAIALMNEVLELEPDNAEAMVIRGLARSQIGNMELSIDDFTFALELIPYRWDFYTFRGDAFAQTGDYADANADYLRALEYNPRYVDAYISLATVAELRGLNDEIEVYQTMARGLISQSSGDIAGAIGIFTDVIALDNTSRMAAYAYYNRALAFYSMDDAISAIEDYSEALALYPQMHDSYLGRGIAYGAEGDLEAAGADFLERMQILETEAVNETVEIGDSIDVTMGYGTVYYLTFEGTAGDTVTMTASAQGQTSVDALIALLGPDETPLAGDDDSGGGTLGFDSEIADFELPEDGTYILVVSHANASFEGPVRVSIR